MASGYPPSPEEFFGFRMGDDGKLARWDRLVEYYHLLDERSDRLRVVELGKTTEGNPLLLVIITSPENHKNLDKIRKLGPTLAYQDGLIENRAEALIAEGKAVVGMAMSIHANEVGGAQMAPELAHELVTGESPEIRRILEETVLLLIPCANPDGNVMVVDWYEKYLGTEYEGCNMPWLYHKYVGHDNNRDLPLQSQVETKALAKLIFEDWFPLAYIDFHHYGSFGGRYYIPPFVNPTDPNVDPLLWTEQQLYGGAMIMRLEAEGCHGVENYAGFTAEFNSTYTRVCTWHGICGMLTESASAKLATPLYVHDHQLQPARRGRPEYRAHVNFPHPWEGGWWRLKDIVKQQKISAYAALEVAANYRETLLRNLYKKARRQSEKGRTEGPYATIFPPHQHDPSTTLKLLDALQRLGVKVHRADEDFVVEGATYPAGSYVVFYSQITRPYLISTLRERFYHDNPWARSTDGAPLGLQDIAGYTLPLMMGVNTVEASRPFPVKTSLVKEIASPKGSVTAEAPNGYVLDGRANDSFRAVNVLLKEGVKVYRIEDMVKAQGEVYPRGSFYVPKGEGVEKALGREAEANGVDFRALDNTKRFKKREVKPLRVAVYQRYYGGNMDEGWTRWLLERYGFEYTTVKDEEILGGLDGKFDVLILPSDPMAMITGEKLEEYFEKRWGGMMVMPNYPPEYRSGIKEEGVDKIGEFVEEGGTLILLNEASEFAIEGLKLPIINCLKDVKSSDFFCPGSLLRVELNEHSPLAYGVKHDSPILFQGGQAFTVKPGHDNEDYDVVIQFPEENMLESGWLIGEGRLSRKAALLDVRRGSGRVVIYGFPTHFRCQTHATFKLLFNALLG